MARHSIVLSALIVCMLIFSTSNACAQANGASKHVIFRDDDIGLGTSLLSTLKAVNQVHVEKNVPVTLAIVPNPLGSNVVVKTKSVGDTALTASDAEPPQHNELLDNPLHGYLSLLASNPLFEFAQHGYTHNQAATSLTSEFIGAPYSTQYTAISRGRSDIRQAFGVTPRTFIPPFNSGDENTLRAAKALGFTEYCTGSGENLQLYGTIDGTRVEPNDVLIDGQGFAQLNESFSTAHNLTDQFLNDPQRSTLIVMYHFWSFSNSDHSVDWKSIQLLRDYLTELKSHGVHFTRLDRGYTTYTTIEGAKPSMVGALTTEGTKTLGLNPIIPIAALLAFSSILSLIGLRWAACSKSRISRRSKK